MAAVGGLQRVVVPGDFPAPAAGAPRRSKPLMLFLLLVMASGLFLARGWEVISAPFGDSHDGRNAGVWAAGARALRDGPVQSRLGTRSPENGVYANHPPLIAVEIAAAEAIGGGSRAATRAPAWLGSLAAILLLGVLLRERGVRGPVAGAAVLLTVATPMFLVFGTMLDTPVTSLPFGLAVLVLWERARAGRRVRGPLAAVALAVLAGWQSLLLAGAVAGWALLRAIRRRGGNDTAFVAGALAGAAVLAVWLWWAFGGAFRPLADAYLFRTGQGDQPVPLAELLHRQIVDVPVMFGVVALLGLLGLVPALARRQTRGLALVALAVTVPYPVVFRTGAVNHEYWDYWFLLPLAVGLAAGGDWVVSALRGRRGAERLVVGAGVALAATMAVAAWVQPTAPGWSLRQGVRAGAEAERAAGVLPSEQGTAWYAGAVGRPAAWISLATARPAVQVPAGEFARLATERPGDLVLVGRVRCLAAGEPHIDYSLERPEELVARPPEVGRCASG